MDAQQRRILTSGSVGRRLDDQAVHFRAVAARRGEVLRRAERDALKPLVVLMREPSELAVLERVDFRRARWPSRRARRTRRRGRAQPVTTRGGRCEHFGTGPPPAGTPRRMLRAVVDDDEEDEATVRRPDRVVTGPVEDVRQHARLARRQPGSPRACPDRRRSTSARRRAGRRSTSRPGSTTAARSLRRSSS